MKTLTEVKETLIALAHESTDGRQYHEFDSLDMIDFIMAVEDHYELDLANLEGETLTFDQFVDAVHKEVNS